MKHLIAAVASLSLTACGLLAQTPTMSCKDNRSGNSASFCEIRETTISALPTLIVDGRQNGGIRIQGANRSDILVRSMVRAGGHSDSEAKSTASQVIVHTSAGTVQADGPAKSDWSVSYEIFVPLSTNLNLKANNGGVSIAGVESSVEFHSVNGGISLSNVGGNVHGDTMNGGVSVNLASAQWKGQGMDVSTQNGGISMKVPERFSAQLELATVNGGMAIKLPNAPQVRRGEKSLNMTLGSGGPLIRIRTKNGGVSVSSNASAA